MRADNYCQNVCCVLFCMFSTSWNTRRRSSLYRMDFRSKIELVSDYFFHLVACLASSLSAHDFNEPQSDPPPQPRPSMHMHTFVAILDSKLTVALSFHWYFSEWDVVTNANSAALVYLFVCFRRVEATGRQRSQWTRGTCAGNGEREWKSVWFYSLIG